MMKYTPGHIRMRCGRMSCTCALVLYTLMQYTTYALIHAIVGYHIIPSPKEQAQLATQDHSHCHSTIYVLSVPCDVRFGTRRILGRTTMRTEAVQTSTKIEVETLSTPLRGLRAMKD
eukprot:3135123-Amphidinium_carterae.2